MTTKELFARYAEETNILSNEKSLLVILYGSRITDEYRDASDLDIFVVVPGEDWCYHREKRLIDGIPIETLYMDKNTLSKVITKEYWNDDKFLESVFFTGQVEKDVDNTWLHMAFIFHDLESKKKEKQELCESWQEELDKCLYFYRHSSGNAKKLYYYKFINFLRYIYHYMNHFSDVTEWKCYQLYTNKDKAKRYRLDLPDDEFIAAFIKTLNPDNMDEALESLYPFVGYTDYEKTHRYKYDSRLADLDNWKRSLSKFDTEKKLIFQSKNIVTVEDKLLASTEDAEFAYYCLLNYLENNSWYVGPKDRTELESVFNLAVETNDTDTRIKLLEDLLHILEDGYKIDYDDYYL